MAAQDAHLKLILLYINFKVQAVLFLGATQNFSKLHFLLTRMIIAQVTVCILCSESEFGNFHCLYI